VISLFVFDIVTSLIGKNPSERKLQAEGKLPKEAQKKELKPKLNFRQS